MGDGARELFRVVSCEPGVVWRITGLAPGRAPRRIWVEVEETPTAEAVVAALFARTGIPSNTAAGEGSAT